MTSTDVGVTQTGATIDATTSIQRIYNATAGTFSWQKQPRTFNACNDDNSGAVTPPAVVKTVVVSPPSATVTVGGTQAYTAKAYDENGAEIPGTTFTWSSSNTAVATVDAASGSARGEAPGDARIIATTSNGTTGDAGIHVDPGTPPAGVPNIRFSEIHYDNVGTDVNEAIEIEGPTGTDLSGWSIVLYNGTASSGGAPAGSVYSGTILTGALSGSCSGRGTLVVHYPQDGIQNGSPDGFALVDAAGHLVEFLSYEGTVVGADGPAMGVTSTDIGVGEVFAPNTSTTGTQSLARSSDGTTWAVSSPNTFGSVNACGAPPAPTTSISFSGRDPVDDPPLPVGFEAQIFATYRKDGATTATTITWSSDTPTIASIDQNGVLRALAAGTAVLRATATDGTTATYSLPTVVATMSGADYAGNTEFGDPNDGNPSDDFIIRRPEYTSSFNRTRNTPNWVSFRLDNTNYGAQDRCNCFTYDPELDAAGFNHITTADYTGAGAFAGFGIDRGHMDRSFDRTAGNLDNATTYYFSNIVPQAADLNQGPWAIMENYLGGLANGGGKQVYVIDGVAGNKGTLKNEGKVVIPDYTWKVAVIMNDGQGLADVHSTSDLQVIAVVMPNIPGIRNVDWNTYKVTVDSVENLSGYDLLALLQDDIERAVEANSQPTVARMDVQPEIISLASTTTVTAYLLSSPSFDATASTPASIRLRVVGGTGPGAPVSQRGTAYLTSITDANGDGRPDRMLVFRKADLVASGMSQTNSQLVLEDVTGTVQFRATDAAPPTVAP
jgi:DNA/RNA endonuclease G (NUC1)